MPSEALLEALDRLREQYGQRQRATNSLHTALKGATNVLNKVGRALRDYPEQAVNGSAALGRAREVFGALRLREEAVDPLLPELRRELKSLGALTAALKDALAALRAESVDVVKLGHALAALRNSRSQDPALAALLPQLEEELEQAQRALGDTFGLALRHALAERGIALGGRPPRFEIGRFELVADFVSRSASLSYGKNLVLKRVPLSVEAVVRAYEREARAVEGRNEDGARWIEQLYTAWEAARRRRSTAEPRANIVDCYYELVLLRQPRGFRSAPSKHAFVDYSRAQFAYDFYEFTARHPVLHQGLRAFGLVATKSQTDNVERSIWIVEGDTPHEGRFIADVKFDRDE
ncbi:MAG TPA: hypothetical protein VNL77_05110 [Roseiflexaceae bacterium]|nr:hypothetical protein [Roseiflexaceae bacterium]